MALRPKPPPDPLADLAGVASCPECGSIVRAYHYLHGATSVYDLGPYAMDDIEAIVGPAWALRQGYGLGRARPTRRRARRSVRASWSPWSWRKTTPRGDQHAPGRRGEGGR